MTRSEARLDAASLPAYSGPVTECVKCGGTEASTEYATGFRCFHGSDDTSYIIKVNSGEGESEWLHRTCRRCGYQWDEQPKQAGTQTGVSY